MGQKQRHRGKHPEDEKLFAPDRVPMLQSAVADLSYLLTREYAADAAMTIVGDRFQLDARQRRAVLRAACPDTALLLRRIREVPAKALSGQPVAIDGYNLLITVESALSGGVLLRGRDGCVRDMASIHGSYHSVEETLPAVLLIGRLLARLGVPRAKWYFDAPVSNSGKLKTLLLAEAEREGWDWEVDIEHNPDKVLAASADVVITGDSWILDRAGAWANFMDPVVQELGMEDAVIDLSAESAPPMV